MNNPLQPRQNRTKDLGFAAIPALIAFTLFMMSSTVKSYGFFIDELYFIACSKRLAWGYIDQPSLSIILLAGVRWLFGNGILAIRFLPALGISALVFLSGLLTRMLGGGRGSMLIAGIAVMICPVFLVFGSFYSMNAFEPLIFTGMICFTVMMIRDGNPRYWIIIGLLMGAGLEMKHTIILYGISMLAGLLVSEKRKLLWNRWFLWAMACSFLFILPNLVWEVVNHFPTLELYRNSFVNKNIDKPALQVLAEQIIFVNPVTFPLWFTGFIMLFFRRWKAYRFMLYGYLILLGVMIAGHSSRPDRITAVYPFFMAMGAAGLYQYLKPKWRKITGISAAILMVMGGAFLAPVFLPVLPPPLLKQHIRMLGLHFDLESGKKGEPIPQWLADRIGWQELAGEVALVYNALPPGEKSSAVIISSNYGEAGALEYYGPEFRLPPVYGTHNAFHTWGPPPDTTGTFIGVFIDVAKARELFESVTEAAVYHCPDCTRPQRQIPVYILRGPKFSFKKEWQGFRIYS